MPLFVFIEKIVMKVSNNETVLFVRIMKEITAASFNMIFIN